MKRFLLTLLAAIVILATINIYNTSHTLSKLIDQNEIILEEELPPIEIIPIPELPRIEMIPFKNNYIIPLIYYYYPDIDSIATEEFFI